MKNGLEGTVNIKPPFSQMFFDISVLQANASRAQLLNTASIPIIRNQLLVYNS
jgi:hypothetical protein